MAERRMSCWNCPRYSRTSLSCADGKTNPKTKADSVMVAEMLGIRALCHYNPFRDRLVALTHFPKERLGIMAVPPPRKRRGRYGANSDSDPLVAGSTPDNGELPATPPQNSPE